MSALVFEVLDESHWDALWEIEQQAHAFPWTLKTLQGSFGRLYFNLGLWQEGRLIGYAIVRVVAGDAELLNFAIDPQYQGLGMGKRLLAALIEQAEVQQWQLLGLEVRESNTAAQQLYLQFDFNEVDCRRNYYPCKQGREDAIIMLRQFL